MKRIALAALALALTGCGGLAADEFREASPSRQGIDIKVPESAGKGLTSGDQGTLEQRLDTGETATWYLHTRNATRAVNGGVAWVLNLCERIVENQPTTIDENQAVWGPHTAPLSPDTFKFTVTRAGTGFDFALEGKPKTEPDSAFVKVISGHHEPGAAPSGTFTIDWDAGQKLVEKPKEIGTAAVTYSRNESRDVKVGVDFKQVREEETGKRIDARYNFEQVQDGNGLFEFVLPEKDVQGNGTLERLAIKSRWTWEGAGRCDVKVSGGDFAAQPATLSECWGATFLRSYYAASFEPGNTAGAESACSFTPASYSGL